MYIGVVDGQGGGMGKAIIEKLKDTFGGRITILALGTNVFATSVMIKAGADESATGENPILFNASKLDLILGTVGIVAANSMHGELTPRMAEAISSSEAIKILIPINKCQLQVVGLSDLSMNEYIDLMVKAVEEYMGGRSDG